MKDISSVCIAHKSLRICEQCRPIKLAFIGLGDVGRRMGNLKYLTDIQ
jgi:hypothetical protein